MKEILDVIRKTIYQFFDVCGDDEEIPISDKDKLLLEVNKAICNNLKALYQEPSRLENPNKWIPVSERLPEELEAVNITWVNYEPEPYYHDIKDKNFVATGIYYKGQWYWYSTTCADYLGEYGSNEFDKVDSAVEIVAWMPLPEPYKAESEEKDRNGNDD